MINYFSVRKKFLRTIYCSPFLKMLKIVMLKKMGVIIGDNVVISYDFCLSDRSSDRGLLSIGNNVDISSKVVVVTTSGPKSSAIKKFYPIIAKKTTIGDDVWLGTGVIILPGVKIGKGSIIGAGCVIDKDIPPFSIVAASSTSIRVMPENLIRKILE